MSSKKDLSLALVVEKETNRVLWAEAGGDVVDVLLSFLTLPLGTAVRVLEKQSGLGCVDELYKSVEALDESYFQTPCCKNMLLRPRSAAECLCQDLPAKVDDSDLTLYACSNTSCKKDKCKFVYSSVKGTCCRCLGHTDRIIICRETSIETSNGVFIDRGGRFSISDDLCISPLSASTTIPLLQRLAAGSKAIEMERMDVQLSREIALKLLQKSLTSKTPLTEVFLQTSGCQPNKLLLPITTKNRIRNEVMYAEIGVDTLDLLFSFLTIPLGSIVRLLGKASRIGCMDNLYQSVEKLCAAKYCAKLEKHRDKLLAPKIEIHYGCSNQLLDIDEMSTAMVKAVPSNDCPQIIAVQINPKLGNGSTEKGGNFVKGKPGMFMVTDDMMVMPNSSFSGFEMMNGWKANVSDMQLMEVVIGKKEALGLLRDLLLSRTPLTNVLCSQTKKGSAEDRCIKREEKKVHDKVAACTNVDRCHLPKALLLLVKSGGNRSSFSCGLRRRWGF